MKAIEFDFTDAATPEMRTALLRLIEGAATLDEIFEEWFLTQGGRFGLSFATDDDDNQIPETLALFFDTADGDSILCATISRSELIKAYPQVAPFNIFVKGWKVESPSLELHERRYKRWLQRLGFTPSYALMARIGSRSGALSVMVSFALSGRGIAEAHHIDPNDPGYEDYELDLDEEGIDLKDYFYIQAAYQQYPSGRRGMRTIFDPFYCRKAA